LVETMKDYYINKSGTMRRIDMINTTNYILIGCIVQLLLAQPYSDNLQKHNNEGFTGEIKVVIYVTDVEKSMPYYRDILGFGFEGFAKYKGEEYYAEMLAGTVKFGLHEPMSVDQHTKVGQQRLYFRVKDLKKQYNSVLAHGGNPEEIIERDWMDMFRVIDMDGNEILFAYTSSSKHKTNPWHISNKKND